MLHILLKGLFVYSTDNVMLIEKLLFYTDILGIYFKIKFMIKVHYKRFKLIHHR